MATALAQAEVDNTATLASSMSSTTNEPLFGPNVGLLGAGPAWAVTNEKKVVSDDLTPDVVKAWIEKSKQPAQPTTTLQALVNLRRPTLRLSPLSAEDGAPNADNEHAQHGFEFEYDCDAPKCGIYLHVLLPKDHPDAETTVSVSEYARLLVYEHVTEGGFGKVLKLEDGAMLELGRFEHGRIRPVVRTSTAQSSSRVLLPVPGEGRPSADSSGEITEIVSTPPEIGEVGRPRRKFAPFHFGKRAPQSRSVAGPALAVVDMGQEDPSGNEQDGVGGVGGVGGASGVGVGASGVGVGAGGADEGAGRVGEGRSKKDKDEGKGVKVMIRLAALDEMGTELMSPNEQVTYLHIVRFGTKDVGVEEGSVEDMRPWVVKVVKREATIGPHTFQLHEIYGLTLSTSAQASAPTAALPHQEHSYPPSTPLPDPPILTPSGVVSGGEEEPQSECLVCLSSPREVVLLPCRHLVACRECALNMVEFGAGGQITQPSEDTAATAEGTEGGESGGSGNTTASGGNASNATTRRRRKAKGWYCPVCRQPYTSLLRISARDSHANV
ncbi:hypothetical protein APHAL10511_005692 [Amanita phalloides]|nr:hypothetical protein APHAL10511_005692 [Amanita phalloides]